MTPTSGSGACVAAVHHHSSHTHTACPAAAADTLFLRCEVRARAIASAALTTTTAATATEDPASSPSSVAATEAPWHFVSGQRVPVITLPPSSAAAPSPSPSPPPPPPPRQMRWRFQPKIPADLNGVVPRGRGTDRWSGTVELAVHLCGEWASTDTTTAAAAAASSSSSGVWSCDPNLALPVTSAPFSVFSTTSAASSLPPASLLSLVDYC